MERLNCAHSLGETHLVRTVICFGTKIFGRFLIVIYIMTFVTAWIKQKCTHASSLNNHIQVTWQLWRHKSAVSKLPSSQHSSSSTDRQKRRTERTRFSILLVVTRCHPWYRRHDMATSLLGAAFERIKVRFRYVYWIETLERFRDPTITDTVTVSEQPHVTSSLSVFVNAEPVESCFEKRARLVQFLVELLSLNSTKSIDIN